MTDKLFNQIKLCFEEGFLTKAEKVVLLNSFPDEDFMEQVMLQICDAYIEKHGNLPLELDYMVACLPKRHRTIVREASW